MKISTFYLDRPEVANAFDLESALRLQKTVKESIKAEAQGLIITSNSTRVFCSGGDLKTYRKLKTKAQGVTINRKIRKILEELKVSPLLVVAAIEGDVLGGGCELALSCDYIVASRSSRFSFRQVKQGLTTGWGGLTPLLNRVSPSTALDWLASGRWIWASEGQRLGLIDDVTGAGTTLTRAESYIETHGGPLVETCKKLIAGKIREDSTFDKLWWSKAHALRI